MTGEEALAELGAVSRSLASIAGPDELRLAHIRQRVLQHVAEHNQAQEGDPRARTRGAGRALWNTWAWQGWARVAVTIIASLLVGGVATAVTGRLIQSYRAARTEPPAVTRAELAAPARRARPRHWRVSVKTPTDLDLVIGPDGAEVDVVGGQASMSGEGIVGSLDVVPGKSWREVEGRPSPPVAPTRPAASDAAPPPRASAPTPTGPAAVRLALVEPAARPAGARAPRRASVSTPAVSDSAAPPASPVEAPPPSPFEPPAVMAPPLPATSPSLSPPASTPALTPSLPGRPSIGRYPSGRSQPSASPPLVPPAAARPPAATSPGAEAALVAQALRRLRRDHDPLLALADLDAHARDFPRGELRHEVTLARAEALLALQRNADALAILDGIRLEGSPTDRRVALARAELRAQEGRRSEAIGDFDRVIRGGGDDELGERALFGRGLCRLRGGDLGGARADLRAHGDRFPTSARHDEVERLLRRLEN